MDGNPATTNGTEAAATGTAAQQTDANGTAPAPSASMATATNASGSTAPAKRPPRPQKTPLQKEALEAAYKINQHPPEEVRKALGDRLGLTEHQIQTWFNHRRRKDKKAEEQAIARQLIAEQQAKEAGDGAAAGPSEAPSGAPAGAPTTTVPAVASTSNLATQTGTSVPAAAVTQPAAAVTQSPAAVAQPAAAVTQSPAAVTQPAAAVTQSAAAVAQPAAAETKPTPSPGAPAGPAMSAGVRPQQAMAAKATPPVNGAAPAAGASEAAAPAATGQWAEFAELLALAKEFLPEPYREDGPRLGFQFDAPPQPGEGAAGGVKRKRVVMNEFEAEYEEGGDFQLRKRRMDMSLKGAQVYLGGEFDAMMDIRRLEDEKRWEEVYKKEQERLNREMAKAQEKSHKEREKELERIHREQLKLQERMEKDRQRDEIRRIKEAERMRAIQEKERCALEKRMEKEKKAEERRKEKEAKAKERDLMKALAASERNATRVRNRSDNAAKDDLDLEYDQLVLQQRYTGYGSDTGAAATAGTPEGTDEQKPKPEIHRPPFPPTWINLPNAFPPPLDDVSGNCILVLWNFLYSFSDVLGMVPCLLDDLVSAVLLGPQHPLLGQVHIAMLKVLQADVEEAHAWGTVMGSPIASGQERSSCSVVLDEAWAWGFDVDAWRAYQDAQTWPEVLRQFAIAAGLGGPRPKGKRVPKPKAPMQEGEDTAGAAQGPGDGPLKLSMPARLGVGTVKAACWQVLSEIGPEGLSVIDITAKIQEQGLRDLSTSKTPEATVAGALSRDAIFARTAPSTYALQTILIHERKKAAAEAKTAAAAAEAEAKSAAQASNAAANADKPASAEKGRKSKSITPQPSAPEVKLESGLEVEQEAALAGPTPQPNGDVEMTEAGAVEGFPGTKEGSPGESDGSDDEEEEGREEQKLAVPTGEPWVHELLTTEYRDLSLATRLQILERLMQMTLETPSVRNVMDARKDASQRIRKQMFEEAKAEKQKRQSEQAARAAAYAEEVAKQAMENPGAPPPPKPAEPEEDHAAAKERAAARAENIRKVEEANTIRVECLGLDRRYNKYWRFAADNVQGGARASGRVWIQEYETGHMRVLGTSEALEGLMSTLLRQGAREGPLYTALLRHKELYAQYMPLGPLEVPSMSDAEVNQLQRKTLDSCNLYASVYLEGESINTPPAKPYFLGDSEDVTRLKWDMLRVRAAIPRGFVDQHSLQSWDDAVKTAPSLELLRGLLGQLEYAVTPDYFSPWYTKDVLRVKGAWVTVGGEVASALVGAHGAILQLADEGPAGEQQAVGEQGEHREPTPAPEPSPLSWLPPTVAAIALKLRCLDAALVYDDDDFSARDQLLACQYIQRPALPHAISAVLSEGKGGSSELVQQAQGKLFAIPGLMLWNNGRNYSSRLPPFPQVLQLQNPQPFSIDQGRLMRDPPVRGPGKGPKSVGKPPAGPSKPSSASKVGGKMRLVPKATASPAVSGATAGSAGDASEQDDEDNSDDEGSDGRGTTPNPNDGDDVAMEDLSSEEEDDQDISE